MNLRTDDGVTKVLFECLYKAEHTEDCEGELVVQLEGGVVDQTFLVFDKMFQLIKHRKHSLYLGSKRQSTSVHCVVTPREVKLQLQQ